MPRRTPRRSASTCRRPRCWAARSTRPSIGDATLLLKSPGLAPRDPQHRSARWRPRWRAASGVAGELDLFVQALADLRVARDYAPRILAVTGTNGKTTTTAMTAQLVGRAGRSVAMAGNIGPTMLQTLAEALDADALPEVWVLELSSFQLDGVAQLRAACGGAAQHHPGPPRLAWLDGGLRRSQGADLRRAHADGRQRRRSRWCARCVAAACAPKPQTSAKTGRVVKSSGPRPLERRVVRFGLGAPQAAG